MVRPDKIDPGTTFKGLDYIDVPANSQREYKLTFFAHKECQIIAKVSKTNKNTSFKYIFKSINIYLCSEFCIANIN